MSTNKEAAGAEVEVIEENFMRLEQYIEFLQALLKEEGNLPVTYAKDDSGNDYGYVRFQPASVLYIGALDGHRQYLDTISKEAADKTKQTVFKAICVN